MPISRRSFLRASGASIALPLLGRALEASEPDAPRRMVCICSNMGMMPQYFWPTGEGRDYRPSEYLSLIDKYRDHYTVFSGISHPDVDGGHHTEIS